MPTVCYTLMDLGSLEMMWVQTSKVQVAALNHQSQDSQEAVSVGPSPVTPTLTPLVLEPFPHLYLKWVSLSV